MPYIIPQPPLIRANEATQEGIQGYQNALANTSHLKTAALQQNALGMQNQEQARSIQKRNELEALLRQTPPDKQWTVTRDWAAVNAPEMALKMDQLGFEAAQNQYKVQAGAPGLNPIQAGVEAQLPANASSPVVPIEQQQVPHPAIQFPSIAGRPAFQATPPTEAQKTQLAGQRKFLEAQSKAAGEFAFKSRLDTQKAQEAQALERLRQQKPDQSLSDTELFMKDRNAYEEMQRLKAKYRPAASGAMDSSDIAAIGNEIIAGRQPPDMSRMYGKSAAIRAYLAKKGYNLAANERDWKAINRHLSTLNGPQQERLRQAITFADDTLPQLERAYAEWKKQAGVSGIRLFNRANLAASKNLGGPAGSAAQQLESLIADFTSELGTVYKGGNSSTDESLRLAAQNLNSDWNELTFGDAIKRLRESIQIRKNSISTSEAVGVSPNSPYAPPMAPQTPPPGGGSGNRAEELGKKYGF